MNNVYRILVSICFALFSSSVFADTLQFIVKVKGTGVAIEGATVVVGEGEIHGTTDKQGRLEFDDVDLPAEIRVLASEYQTYNQTIQTAGQVVKVYLYPVEEVDEGLSITKDRIEEKTSKFVLSAKELKSVPGTFGDPIVAVTSMPGVVAAGTGIYVRGSGGGDQGVWVNKIPVDYLFHFTGVSTINPDLLEDFNLFLGGFPVEYPNGIGGFLDVKLRKPHNDRFRQKYRVGLTEAAFLIEGPAWNKKNSYYLAARRSYIDLLFSPEELTDLINEDDDSAIKNEINTVPRYNDVQGMWHTSLDNGDFFLQFLSASDALAFTNNKAIETDPEAAGLLSARLRYWSLGSGWQQRLSDNWTSDVTLAYKISHENFRIGTDPITGTSYFVDNEIRQLRSQPNLQWNFTKKDQMDFGVELFYGEFPVNAFISAEPTENDPGFDFSLESKYRVNKTLYAHAYSPYVKYVRDWNNRIRTNIGLRYSTIEGTGGIDMQGLAPRFNIEYKVNRALTLSAVWGRYLQMPATDSQLVEGLGNPRLKLTDAEHRILGLNYEFNSNWSTKMELFHTPVSDLSVKVANAAPPDNFINAGEGESYGFDLYIKRETKNRKTGWLSYSYIQSRRTNTLTGESRDYSGEIPHNLSLVWSQPMPGRWKKWLWGAKMVLRSGAPYTPVVGRTGMCLQSNSYVPCADQTQPENDANFTFWTPQYASNNIDRLPFFYRLDFRIEKQTRLDNAMFNFFFDFYNVSFSKNVVGYDYGNKYQNIDNPKEITNVPFIPFIGVEVTY